MSEIVWFRKDLRLEDNPAWSAATNSGNVVVPLFIVDPRLWERASDPRIRLLAAHLQGLDDELARVGGRLMVHTGVPEESVPAIAERLGASLVHVNADHTPFAKRRDTAISSTMSVETHHGSYVHRPGSILTNEGGRYRVFTPYHRRWAEEPAPHPHTPGDAAVSSERLEEIPDPGPPPVTAGSVGAEERLAEFERHVDRYRDERDRPDLDATSRLSIDLKWGTIGPRALIHRIGTDTPGRAAFVRQLAWRDFYADILDDRPNTVDEPLRPEYRTINWNDDPQGFEAWKRGMTGYPIIDAGIRQLLAEGWVHNRVRMLVASFLVKDLLIDWRLGERFFRHHLIDGDVAQNVGNWQWVAGTGADAAPYFRIFNPVSQSRKFDPAGRYIKRWIPELARLDAPAIHAPWEAGPLELTAADVTLDETYPSPIVDHPSARERTLARYKQALAK